MGRPQVRAYGRAAPAQALREARHPAVSLPAGVPRGRAGGSAGKRRGCVCRPGRELHPVRRGAQQAARCPALSGAWRRAPRGGSFAWLDLVRLGRGSAAEWHRTMQVLCAA